MLVGRLLDAKSGGRQTDPLDFQPAGDPSGHLEGSPG
jgi:hypothetical protein